MRESSLRIKRGAVHKITVAATTDSVLSSAIIWTLYDDREQTLKAVLSAGESLILGPYLNITRFRIQEIGTVTIEEIGDDFSVPISLFAHQDIDLGAFNLTTTGIITGKLPVTKITSTYPVLPGDVEIEVTIDAADIDVLLLPLTSVTREVRILRNNIGAGSAVLNVIADGSEKIKEPGGVLISNKTIDGDGDSLSLLGINSAHHNIV